MKIHVRKDHPLTILFIVLFFAVIMKDRLDTLSYNDITFLAVFLLALLAAYYAQIEQTILLKNGKLKLIKKREEIELKATDIEELALVGKSLQVTTPDLKLTLEGSHFTKKQIVQINDELKKWRISQPE